MFELTSPAVRSQRPRRFALKSPHPKISENHVEERILAFFVNRGWFATRNHVGRFRPLSSPDQIITIGEKGITDWLFTRPARGDRPAGVVWAEIKRPGEEPSSDQVLFIDRMRVLGFHAGWWDSVESLEEWYFEQGF